MRLVHSQCSSVEEFLLCYNQVTRQKDDLQSRLEEIQSSRTTEMESLYAQLEERKGELSSLNQQLTTVNFMGFLLRFYLGRSSSIVYLSIYLSICLYINLYIAPLQGNYSEALPAQARPKRRVLRSL